MILKLNSSFWNQHVIAFRPPRYLKCEGNVTAKMVFLCNILTNININSSLRQLHDELTYVIMDDKELQTWRWFNQHVTIPKSSPREFTFTTNHKPPTGLSPWMSTAHPFRNECVLRLHEPANRRAKSGLATNQMGEWAGPFYRKRCWISTLRVVEPVSLMIV